MFDSGGGEVQDVGASASDAWCRPGRTAAGTAIPAEPDAAAQALVAAVDALMGQDLQALAGAVALDRCRTVLSQTERLGAVAATALADVAARELWADDGAGSLAGWLRQQTCGDVGRSTRSRRLAERPAVLAALATGSIGLVTADVLCRALADLPEVSEPGQVEGVLTGAVPELLSRWTARNALDPGHDPVAEARSAHLEQVIADGCAATDAAPAERLEAAFVLLGQAVGPSMLASQLQLLADALVPEQLAADEQAAYDGRSLVLRKKKLSPGWRLDAHLTDEVGAALRAELDTRAEARRQAEARLRAAAETGSDDVDAFGQVGPGTVPDATPRLKDDQLAHDLLGELLEDLNGVREPGAPAPTPLTVTAGVDTAEDRLGALPGTLLLPTGPVPISPAATRRHGCHSRLSAVLLDAARTPVGASGSHRSATARERRALRAKWGDHCAGNGCASTRTVPHHVRPWWQTGRTTLEDLVPLCKGNHHDLHDGHRTLRLRDGRLIDENGWVEEDPRE